MDRGYVYGNAPGTATITAKTANGKTANCTVTVRTNSTSQSASQDSSESTIDINAFDFTPYAQNAYKAISVYAGNTVATTDLWGGFSPNRQYVYILLEDSSVKQLYRVRYKVGSTDNPLIMTFSDTAWGFISDPANKSCVWKELNIGVLL